MKKIDLKKFKLSFQLRLPWKYIYLGFIIVFIVGILYAVIFVFNDILQTIYSSEDIITLRQEVVEESFNIQDFENIIDDLEKKQDRSLQIDWSGVKNIFHESGLRQPLPSNISDIDEFTLGEDQIAEQLDSEIQ